MKPETLEWVEKAEGDLKVARREMEAGDPVWNVVCFLAQQCGEKYLKAFLEELNTHARCIPRPLGRGLDARIQIDSSPFGSKIPRCLRRGIFNITFPRTHDLVVLLNISGEQLPELKSHKEQLARLSVFGIAARYPGRQADIQAAEDSMNTAEIIRSALRARFGLS